LYKFNIKLLLIPYKIDHGAFLSPSIDRDRRHYLFGLKLYCIWPSAAKLVGNCDLACDWWKRDDVILIIVCCCSVAAVPRTLSDHIQFYDLSEFQNGNGYLYQGTMNTSSSWLPVPVPWVPEWVPVKNCFAGGDTLRISSTYCTLLKTSRWTTVWCQPYDHMAAVVEID